MAVFIDFIALNIKSVFFYGRIIILTFTYLISFKICNYSWTNKEKHLHGVSVALYKFMAYLNSSKNNCKSWRKIKNVNVEITIRSYKITDLMFKAIKSIKTTIFFI